jgi:hypothetical protein
MVQLRAADVVCRVDHDTAIQRRTMFGEQRRDRGARHRQQHDLGAGDRIRDRDGPRRVRRPRGIDHLVTRAPPRLADRRSDVATADHPDAGHGAHDT